MIPELVQTWLVEQGYGPVSAIQPVGGGCINQGTRLVTHSGTSFFLKTNRHCPPDMFAREAEGLSALSRPDGPRVPQSFLFGVDFLLLEDLHPSPPTRDYWSAFGRQLAVLHTHTSPQFGFTHDNYIGSTPQLNPQVADGYIFFAQHRLVYQADLAGKQGFLSTDEVRGVYRLADRLPDFIPLQPASMVHGDMWSGNMIIDENGHPALIDPAAHYGWAEADLAMAALFGAPPEAFYHAYEEARPLLPGLDARFPVYNLYHLLNHLNLFGRGYYRQVVSIIHRFR